MKSLRTWMMVGPALLAGLSGALLLHQPSDAAGAFTDGGSAIYAAQVIGTVQPTTSRKTVTHALRSATSSLLPVRQALTPASGFVVTGAPTIAVAVINQVLAAYGSPMAGQGQDLYDLGVKYGIDPAYALAFFVHESACGTRGEAVLTHSLGNIRPAAGTPSMDGYRYYDTWLEGADDWYRLISNLYVRDWGLTTVDTIIPTYAPSNDSNDPAAYINDVEQLVTAWRAQSS